MWLNLTNIILRQKARQKKYIKFLFSLQTNIQCLWNACLYGKKDINSMSKRLAKDNRETIEAKDVKLLTNLDEIEKTDLENKMKQLTEWILSVTGSFHV